MKCPQLTVIFFFLGLSSCSSAPPGPLGEAREAAPGADSTSAPAPTGDSAIVATEQPAASSEAPSPAAAASPDAAPPREPDASPAPNVLAACCAAVKARASENDNLCYGGIANPDCPMTLPGGYCDPNGDGSFADGDWSRGWNELREACP